MPVMKTRPIPSWMSKPAIVSVLGVILLALVATAGSLTPSALPAATMHSLANIYDSIASAAFDSSAIVANQNGSLLGNLKYIENQIVWASGSNNIWSLNSGNVGIGTTVPTALLAIDGTASISGLTLINNSASVSANLEVGGSVRLTTTVSATSGVITKDGLSFIHDFTPSGGLGKNTFIGIRAGNFTMNTVDDDPTGNTAVGYEALLSLTGGPRNSAFGAGAMRMNTLGFDNAADGHHALYSNTTGASNVALGSSALYSNTTGDSNTAIGATALWANLTGLNNSAVGNNALYNNIGENNSAIGKAALFFNTTGANNSAIGISTLFRNRTGSANTVIGAEAGFGSPTLSDISSSSLFGYRAGYSLLTGGDNNILIGYRAGDALTTGNTNIIIGYNIDAPSPTSVQTLNIGNLIFGTGLTGTNTTLSTGNVGIGSTTPEQKLEVAGNILASASAASIGLILNNLSEDDAKFTIQSTGTAGSVARLDFLGSASQTFLSIASSGYVGIGNTAPATLLHIGGTGVVDATALLRLQDANSTCNFTANADSPTCGSDLRLKKDITPIGDRVLSKLSSLQVVTYHWNTDSASASFQTGFIAQNVQTSFPSLVATASWIDGHPALFLSQNGLIPYLVKGIQELASKDLLIDDILSSDPVLTEEGPLARLVRNILAYIADVLGIELSQGTVKTDRLCAGTACVDEAELQQLRQLLRSQSAEPTTVPTVLPTISVEPPVASASETLTPTATPVEED